MLFSHEININNSLVCPRLLAVRNMCIKTLLNESHTQNILIKNKHKIDHENTTGSNFVHIVNNINCTYVQC